MKTTPYRIPYTALRAAVIGVISIATPLYVGAQTLGNPLNPALSSIPAFIEAVTRAVVLIALPIIALFIVYAGFKYVFARGDASKISEAHSNFVYVIIGAILILGAWVFATLIGGTVTQLLGR